MQDIHTRARQLNRKQWRGFTIVEVLIVVVVIAILAAVTVVAYNGITASAKESALRSDLSTAAKRLNVEKVESGSFPSSPTFISSELRYLGGGNEFCVTGETGSKSLHVTESGSVREGGCPPPETMQAMTSGYCTSMTPYNGSNPNAILSLTDNRGGGRAYEVARLADGECWMLTNLKLGSTSGTITLTPADSDVVSEFILPQLTTTGVLEHDLPRAYGPVPGDTGAGSTNYGYLYNWSAATAGESRTSMPAGSGDAANSICPANWSLPTHGTNSKFDWLNSKMNNPDATSSTPSRDNIYNQNWLYSGPFKGVFSGSRRSSFESGGYGDLWSRTSATSNQNYASNKYFYPTTMNRGYSIERNAGLAIRCVLD